MSAYPKLLIIELGSQYTLKIASSLRELGHRAAVLNPKHAELWVKQHPVEGIILSGGYASVYEENAPAPPLSIFDLTNSRGQPVPILGICYGMQWLVKYDGGRVGKGSPSYGRDFIDHDGSSDLLLATSRIGQMVWMSHGDSVQEVPNHIRIVAKTSGPEKAIAAVEWKNRHYYGLQFHPEVDNTPQGKHMLREFVSLCECASDWSPHSLIGGIQETLAEGLAKNEHAVGGFSGGVDSTVLSTIAGAKLQERYHAITINADQLRENEMEEVRAHAKAADVKLHEVEASARFYASFTGLVDAQEKRKKGFQPPYSAVFQETARSIGPDVSVLLQGTLAPDEIESGVTGGDLIKAHHNVGLDTGHLRQLHPLRTFFKYEIRALAKELGLPESVCNRQPFPGPGLFIRNLWAPCTPSRIATVRWADARVKEVLKAQGVYDKLSQLVVAYGNSPTVGIKGDKRVYAGMVFVRAVQTLDFMTAEGYTFAPEAQTEICNVVGKHADVVHVAFCPMNKPPATTEFE